MRKGNSGHAAAACCEGFEIGLVRAITLEELHNTEVEIRRLPTYEDRITSLLDGTVDWCGYNSTCSSAVGSGAGRGGGWGGGRDPAGNKVVSVPNSHCGTGWKFFASCTGAVWCCSKQLALPFCLPGKRGSSCTLLLLLLLNHY